MSGNNISRQPANRVGGQRRRLSRPPPRGVPRSRTLPVLHGDPGSGDVGHGVGQESQAQTQEGVIATRIEEGAASLEISQSMINFYAPTGGLADLRNRDTSPTPTSESASTIATDGKKKHGLALANPFRSKQAPPSQTPLPPATPTKAAKLLGLESESLHANPVPVHQNNGTLDGINEERPRIKQGWPQKYSTPVLTAPSYQSTSRIFFEDIETEDEDEPPKSKGFWDNSKKTAKKLSGSLTSFFTSSQSDIDRRSLPSIVDASPEGLYTNFVNSIGFTEFDHSAHSTQARHEPPPRSDSTNVARHQQTPPKTISKHRARKEQTKDQMKKMTPVTEASHDNMSAAYDEDEDKDNSEMDLIDEYANGRRSDDFVPPQRSESLMPHTFGGQYGLAPGEVSPSDEEPEQGMAVEKEELWAAHPGTLVQINKPLPALRRRSPLQVVEDRFLDAAEKELEAKQNVRAKLEESPPEDEYAVHGMPVELSKAKQLPAIEEQVFTPLELELQKMKMECDAREATRVAMDKQVAVMKESHEQFKKDFAPYKALVNGSEIIEDEDHVSIRSSIDLDEEPTVHVAKAVTITRITPGMVKLVDIPPRKNKKYSEAIQPYLIALLKLMQKDVA